MKAVFILLISIVSNLRSVNSVSGGSNVSSVSVRQYNQHKQFKKCKQLIVRWYISDVIFVFCTCDFVEQVMSCVRWLISTVDP